MISGANHEEQVEWVDQLVQTALENCSSREWYKLLIDQVNLEKLFAIVRLWRAGEPITVLEANWIKAGAKEKDNRINLGRFLNHQLSLITQLWGAIAVCYEEIHGPQNKNPFGVLLQQLPAFTREGVMTEGQLNWLTVISGIDRVLAHKLAVLEDFDTLSQNNIRAYLTLWRSGSEELPLALKDDEKLALRAIIKIGYAGKVEQK